MADNQDVIGEVIEASTTEFLAESRELHSPPPFGCFVKVGWDGQDNLAIETASTDTAVAEGDEDDPFMADFRRMEGRFGDSFRSAVHGEEIAVIPDLSPAIYGVVYQATTTPVDSGRRLRAFWKDEEQLAEEQPELSEWMLVTNFRAIIFGYSANGLVRRFLPPQPPKLFTGVQPCSADEIRLITSRMDFLRTLVNFRNAPTEEVISACIRNANNARGGDREFLVSAGKELANLLKDDYDRLYAIMRRFVP